MAAPVIKVTKMELRVLAKLIGAAISKSIEVKIKNFTKKFDSFFFLEIKKSIPPNKNCQTLLKGE
jgi:hypothetical protein